MGFPQRIQARGGTSATGVARPAARESGAASKVGQPRTLSRFIDRAARNHQLSPTLQPFTRCYVYAVIEVKAAVGG